MASQQQYAVRLRTFLFLIVALLSVPIARINAEDKKKAAVPPDAHKKEHTNRLAKETSPYLLMHAHNPVDWYPWGPEALQKARKENKLIFCPLAIRVATGATLWNVNHFWMRKSLPG